MDLINNSPSRFNILSTIMVHSCTVVQQACFSLSFVHCKLDSNWFSLFSLSLLLSLRELLPFYAFILTHTQLTHSLKTKTTAHFRMPLLPTIYIWLTFHKTLLSASSLLTYAPPRTNVANESLLLLFQQLVFLFLRTFFTVLIQSTFGFCGVKLFLFKRTTCVPP